MEQLTVTTLWMAGVVAMMGIFGAVAWIGYLKLMKNGNNAAPVQTQDQSAK